MTQVHRIARRLGFTKLVLGSGPNGMVLYELKEVIAHEESRKVKLTG